MQTTDNHNPLPLAVTAQQITDRAAPIIPISLIGWRRMDASGKCPRGFTCGGRKVWRLADLQAWTSQGFPSREDFERTQRGGSQ